MAKTDVATVDEKLPSYLKDVDMPASGSDNFDSSDVYLPRIKLLQGLSGELETFDNAKKGHFWHTGLDLDLGEEIRFVIADRRKKYLLAAPINDGQGVLARADDAKTWDRTGEWRVKLKDIKQPVDWKIEDRDVIKSGLTQWGTWNPADEDSPPAATLFYDYLVFLPDRLDLGPAIISLARSQIKMAKKGLNDKIKFQIQNGRPMQSCIFNAKSIDDSADGQDFKNWQFVSGGFVQDKSLYDMAVEHSGALAEIKIQDEVGEDHDRPGFSDDGEGDF